MRKELAWLRRGAPARTSKPKFRIDAAKQMLLDKRLSTKEVAFALGYSEVANFANHFKRATGASPGVYRERS